MTRSPFLKLSTWERVRWERVWRQRVTYLATCRDHNARALMRCCTWKPCWELALDYHGVCMAETRHRGLEQEIIVAQLVGSCDFVDLVRLAKFHDLHRGHLLRDSFDCHRAGFGGVGVCRVQDETIPRERLECICGLNLDLECFVITEKLKATFTEVLQCHHSKFAAGWTGGGAFSTLLRTGSS